jgi:hypothetical protein
VSVVLAVDSFELCAGLDVSGSSAGGEGFDPGGVLGDSSVREVAGFDDLFVVIFRSWVIEPRYTLRSTGRPAPAIRP